LKAVGIAERDAVPLPVRVRRLQRLGANALAYLGDNLFATEIENHECLRMRRRRSVLASTRELEMSARSRHSEKDPVVALMVIEAPHFRQAETVSIELHDRVESVRMSCDP